MVDCWSGVQTLMKRPEPNVILVDEEGESVDVSINAAMMDFADIVIRINGSPVFSIYGVPLENLSTTSDIEWEDNNDSNRD